jgi:tetratricopeptide (TPR) repeat protein
MKVFMINKTRRNIFFDAICLPSVLLIFFAIALPGFASDLSDATALRERCEREIAMLEVCVKNFGDNVDIDDFAKGEQLIKLGKVKFVQTKYPEAIEIYKNYLNIQFNLYEVLAKKYITRTDKINDDVGEELVDFANDKKVLEYLRLASQNLKDAKAAMATKHYKSIIDVCRTSKNYALGTYKVAGKTVPDQYNVDVSDNQGKIYNQSK